MSSHLELVTLAIAELTEARRRLGQTANIENALGALQTLRGKLTEGGAVSAGQRKDALEAMDRLNRVSELSSDRSLVKLTLEGVDLDTMRGPSPEPSRLAYERGRS